MQNQNPENEAKKKRIQMEIVLKDSDAKKCARTMVEAEILLRDLKHKKMQIEIEIADAEAKYKKSQTEQVVLQNELKRLKNSLNFL